MSLQEIKSHLVMVRQGQVKNIIIRYGHIGLLMVGLFMRSTQKKNDAEMKCCGRSLRQNGCNQRVRDRFA